MKEKRRVHSGYWESTIDNLQTGFNRQLGDILLLFYFDFLQFVLYLKSTYRSYDFMCR